MLLISLILLSVHLTVNSARSYYKIGGLFGNIEDGNVAMGQKLFARATRSTFPSDELPTTLSLKPEISNIEINNSIDAKRAVCYMLQESVIGIFGPLSRESAWMVKSISDTKEIPHIQTRYDNNQYRSSCGINLYPHPSSLSKAYADVIKTWGWKNFVIIYEDNESLIRISALLKPEVTNAASVQIIQLPVEDDYRSMFRRIRQSKETNILLDCTIEKLPEVLKQAQQTGLMIENYNYIITCLDLHTIDLEPYQYSGVNITGFRLINPSKFYVQNIIKKELEDFAAEEILVEAALLFDAVNLFKKTLAEFKHRPAEIEGITDSIDQPIPTCENSFVSSWKAGFSIVNAMKVTELLGLTGLIKFDYEGFRTNIELQIIELTGNGTQDKGTWNTSTGVQINTIASQSSNTIQDLQMANTTFKVIISLISVIQRTEITFIFHAGRSKKQFS